MCIRDRKQGEGGGTLKRLTGVRRNRNENASTRPNGLRENAETVSSSRVPGSARKKKGIPAVEGRRKKMHR